MHDKGYGAVGVGEICSTAGVNKGSFYYFFESKQLLGIAALDAYWAEARRAWRRVLEGPGEPLERIERMMAGPHRHSRESKKACGHVRGCMLGNFALEQSTQDPEVQKRLRQIFEEQVEMVAAVLREADEAGQLAEGMTPEKGSRALLAFIEGMVMLAKVHNDPSMLRGMAAPALRLVAA